MAIETDPKRNLKTRLQTNDQHVEQQARLQDEQRQRELISPKDGHEAAVPNAAEEHRHGEETERRSGAPDQLTAVHTAGAQPETSGEGCSDVTVKAAGLQQDKGERWQLFAEVPKGEMIPPSVEAKAAEERQETQQREQQQINIGDLIKQMSIQAGKIDA